MFKNRIYWVLGLVALLALAGAAVTATSRLTFAGGADDDQPITGAALEKASAAALAQTGGGRVTATEVGDEDSYYQVEVTLDDGSQVDVQLDANFAVVTQNADDESTDNQDGVKDDDGENGDQNADVDNVDEQNGDQNEADTDNIEQQDGDQNAADDVNEAEDGDAQAPSGTLDDGKDLLPQAGIKLDQAITAAQSAASGSVGEIDLEDYQGELAFNVDVGDKDVKVNAADGSILAADSDD